jgi:hypothetical protein
MSPLKLLALSGLVRGAYGKWLFNRFMSAAIAVAGLAIVAIMMTGALLVGGFYTLYVVLLDHQFEQWAAFLIVAAAILVTIALFIFLTISYLRRLRKKMFHKSRMGYPSEVVNAFFDGLLSK